MNKILGANYRTTLSAAGTAIMAALTFFSTVSYDQGPISMVIPMKYKPWVAIIAGISTLVLWIYNGMVQKDKSVTGGTTQQDANGVPVPLHEAALAQTTIAATPPESRN